MIKFQIWPLGEFSIIAANGGASDNKLIVPTGNFGLILEQ